MNRTCTPSPRGCAGLTIIEAVIAMVIVGVMLVAAIGTVGAARKGEASLNDAHRAQSLVQDLMNEILAQAYADSSDTAAVTGPTATEAATGNRSLFNDVNDYKSWTESPPKAKDGTALTSDATWAREAKVEFLNPASTATVVATDQSLARVTVTVKHRGVVVASLVGWRSAGLPATESCTLPGGSCVNLAPRHCQARGGASGGPGTNCWTTAELPAGGVGLVAHWKMNETSGTTATDSKGSNHGTLTNGPTFTTLGKYGNALNLDGTNDYVVVNHHSSLSIDSTLTLAAWVYPTAVPDEDDEWFGIFHKGQTSSTRNYFLRLYEEEVSFGFRDTTGTTQRFTGGSITTANRWYHIAATYEDATDKVILYVDGVARTTITTTRKPQTNTSAMNIGNGYSGISTDYFKGRIDDARIYSRVLSAAEIATLFNGGEP